MDGDEQTPTTDTETPAADSSDANTPTTTPAAEAPDARNFDAGAAPSTPTPGQPPDTSNLPAKQQQEPPVSLVPSPNVVKPAKRGGLAGIIDDIADQIAGTKGPGKVYTDKDGNEYIEHPTLSRKQQWIKIAGEAIRGAAAGAAVGQGPGGKARAAAAGIEAGDKMAQQERENDAQQTQEVRQANQENFNRIKLQHDMAAKEFELGRMKVEATQHDIQFAQAEEDRMQKLMDDGKAFDLGVYKDEAALPGVQQQNPTFWKDVYKGNITAVPVIGPDGKRQGIHIYKTTPGIGNEQVPDGTSFKVYVPPTKPGEQPTYEDHVPTGPMTWNQKHAYDLAAANQMQQWQKDQTERSLKESETTEHKAAAKRDIAEAAKDNAEAAGQASVSDPKTLDDIIDGGIVPERLGYLLGKKEGQQLIANLAARAQQRGVQFDSSKLQQYPALYKDYTSGKRAQQLTNMGTAFKTIDELNDLNGVQARIPGTAAYNAYQTKLTNVSTEVANGLAKPGTAATKDEIAQVKNNLGTNLRRGAAINAQIGSLVNQYVSVRNNWMQGAPSASYEAKMPDLSGQARAVVAKYALTNKDQEVLADVTRWWGAPVVRNGKVIGFSRDGKNMEAIGQQ